MGYLEWMRSQVGTRKIFLAFGSVALFDADGRLLLQHRTDFDVWGLPGGILELGEDIESCTRRELNEETGLIAGKLKLVGVYSDPKYDTVYPNGDQVQQYTLCFRGSVRGGQMQVDGVETSAQAFFQPGDLPFHQIPIWYQAMIRDALHGTHPAFDPPRTLMVTKPQIAPIREIIGPAPYIGVGALAVVRDLSGRILMVRRTDNAGWSFPGGYMHFGENIAYTAIRETYEETGLNVYPENLMGVYSPRDTWTYPNGDQVQAVISIFRSRLLGGHERPDQEETSQIAWLSPEEILALDLHPLLTRLHRTIIEHLDEGCFVSS